MGTRSLFSTGILPTRFTGDVAEIVDVPQNTAVPEISFTTLESGQEISWGNGSWSNSPTSYTDNLYADGVSVATSSPYTLTDSEAGKEIRVGVVATNIIGSSTEAFSTAYSVQDLPVEPPTSVEITALENLVAYWDGQSGISGTTWANQIATPADGQSQSAYNVTLSNASLFDENMMVADNTNYITGTNTPFLRDMHKGNDWSAAFFLKTPDSSITVDSFFGTASTTGNHGIEMRGDSSGVLKVDQFAGGSAVTKQMTAVTNRGFSSGSTGWTITGTGAAIVTECAWTASNAVLSQTLPHAPRDGVKYRVSGTVSGYSAGSLTPSLCGTAGTAITANGAFTQDIVAGSDGILAFTASGFTGIIDNVDVRLAPNEYYLFIVSYDASLNQLSMSLDGSTFEVISAGWGASSTDATYDFNLMSDGNNSGQMDSTAALLGCWFANVAIDEDTKNLWADSAYAHFIPPAATIPDDPVYMVAVAGNGSIYMNYHIDSDGKSSLTDTDIQYKESSSGTWLDYTHSATGINRSVSITSGLTNGTEYNVRVRPRNAIGPSTNWTSTWTVTPLAHTSDPYDETVAKVTLPVDVNGWRVVTPAAYEILQASIGSYNDAFFCRSNNGFMFTAVFGNKTATAKYSRTECRAMTNITYNLDGTVGYNVYDEKTINVVSLPLNTKTVIHQYHDASEPWFKVQFYRQSSGVCRLQTVTTEYASGPDINNDLVTAGTYDIGDAFKSKVLMTYEGIETTNTDPNYYNKARIRMDFYVDDVLKLTKYRYAASGDGSGYFKFGNYLQSTDASIYSQVFHSQGSYKYTPS